MSAIVTEYVAPPVPTTMYDWVAYVEGDEETCIAGASYSQIHAQYSISRGALQRMLSRETYADVT